MRTDEDLLDQVNKSGFPLQLAVERMVKTTGVSSKWEMRGEEHHWKHPNTAEEGFIDLVLTQLVGVVELVLECKRRQDSEWIFLKPSKAEDTTAIKGLVSKNRPERMCLGWHDLQAKVSSPEAGFCIVTGESDTSRVRPMLERDASTVVAATEALAEEDTRYRFPSVDRSPARVYLPAIVTTASLKLCSYDPLALIASSGTLDTAEFTDAKFVRFRKQVSAIPSALPNAKRLIDPSLVAAAKESTVFVININALDHFLEYLQIYDGELIEILEKV